MSGGQESIQQLLEQAVKRARARKPPSARNRQIADAVWVNGRTQVEVAAEFRLSQRRVSQICQQVEAWQAQTQAWQRGQTCGSEEKEVENELQKRQLTEIYRRSMRAFTRSERPLVSRRSRKCGGDEQWSEEHEREQRLDTGSLRVALRALEQRSKLAPRTHPQRSYASDRHVDNLEWIVHILSQYRSDAEQRGEVPRGQESPKELVERLMRELLAGSKSEGGTGMLPVPEQPSGSEVAASADPTTAGPRSRTLDGDTGPETQPSAANQHWQDASATRRQEASATRQLPFGEKRLGYFGQTNLRQKLAEPDQPSWMRLNWALLLLRQQAVLLDPPHGAEQDLLKEIDDVHQPVEPKLTAALKLLDLQAARLEAAARSSSVRDIEAQVEEQLADSDVALTDVAAATCDEASSEAAAQAFEPRSATDRADAAEGRALERAESQRKARARIEYQFGSVMSDDAIAAELAHLRQWEKGCYSMTEHSREQREALIEWRHIKKGRNLAARTQPSG